jgi:quinol monooxygenase YgiN
MLGRARYAARRITVTCYQYKKAIQMKTKKREGSLSGKFFVTVTAYVLTLIFGGGVCAQEKKAMVRLAKIVVDSAQLESYKVFAKEEIETSLRVERGVLTLFAVSEKANPTHITILEIYADTIAYKKHIKTPHFLKYKNGTIKMVQSLELIETDPLIPDSKLTQVIGAKK